MLARKAAHASSLPQLRAEQTNDTVIDMSLPFEFGVPSSSCLFCALLNSFRER